MDYQFKRDLYGNHTAKLSMGHEAFGHWLTDEISNSPQKLKQIQTVIESIKNKKAQQFEYKGHEFQLHLTAFEAQVEHHKIGSDFDDFHADELGANEDSELNDYEQELEAECGFEDFVAMFNGWVEFVGG